MTAKRRLEIFVRRFEERMAELIRQQLRLREAKDRGLVYARVRRRGYRVSAYDVAETTVYCLVRPNPKPRLKPAIKHARMAA